MSNTAESQARAQYESIAAMVGALDVDYGRITELRDTIHDFEKDEKGAAEIGKSEFNSDVTTHVGNDLIYAYDTGRELAQLESDANGCEDEDAAIRAIEEYPLSIEFRSAWESDSSALTPSEFRIVLCTGGPHVEIVGDLNAGEPSRPRILYRDWNESGELFDFDHDTVIRYCLRLIFVG